MLSHFRPSSIAIRSPLSRPRQASAWEVGYRGGYGDGYQYSGATWRISFRWAASRPSDRPYVTGAAPSRAPAPSLRTTPRLRPRPPATLYPAAGLVAGAGGAATAKRPGRGSTLERRRSKAYVAPRRRLRDTLTAAAARLQSAAAAGGGGGGGGSPGDAIRDFPEQLPQSGPQCSATYASRNCRSEGRDFAEPVKKPERLESRPGFFVNA